MTVEVRRRPPTQARRITLSTEAIFVLFVIAGVMLLTSLPYLYAYLSSPPEKQFMGVMLDVPDHAQYFSWMRELSTANLSANKLTPEVNQPVFFNLLWWLMGRAGRLLGWGFGGMLQLLRFAGGVLFLLALYRFYRWIFKDPAQRKTAFLITIFTSGFGWILIGLKYTLTQGRLLFPLDVFIAEGNTFLGLIGYPHFIAALLYIFVFDLFLRGEARGQLRFSVYAGIVGLLLGWQHAYDLLIVYGVIAAYVLLRWLRDRKPPVFLIQSGAIIGAISWWPALYAVLLTTLVPLWGAVLAQFPNAGVFSPPLYRLPVLMGPAFLFALYVLARRNPLRLQGFSHNDLFIAGWFLITFALIYVPIDFQVHNLNGWQIPIAVLATQGLFQYALPALKRYFARRWKQVSAQAIQWGLVAFALLSVAPTNVYLWAWRFVDLSRHTYPYYFYKEEIDAMKWLDAHTAGNEVVLSSEMTGQYLPALSGASVFLGHWAQTVDYFGKTEMVSAFFSEETGDSRRVKILEDYGIDYIFWGPAERMLGAYEPKTAGFLKAVYASPQVSLFQVQLAH